MVQQRKRERKTNSIDLHTDPEAIQYARKSNKKKVTPNTKNLSTKSNQPKKKENKNNEKTKQN